MGLRKQKRFDSQLDIEVEIIKQKSKLKELMRHAELQRLAIKSNFDKANDPAEKYADYYRQIGHDIKKERHKTLSCINRIDVVILPALKRASAEMKTGLLPFTEDKTVIMNER